MAISKVLVGSALASFAVASGQPMMSRDAPRILLSPAVHPSVDSSDLSNLRASHVTTLHYDSNADPQVDSTIATIYAPSSTYPVVQLENTQFVKSVACSADTANIAFSDKTAFDAAVADWQKYEQFIFASHDPKCGSGYVNGKRDFALVKSMSADASTLTVNADVSFVDYTTVVGEDTKVTSSFGQYTAANFDKVGKRTSKSETISWNEYPTNSLTDSQWGSGFQIYSGSELDLICVNCGTQGSMTLTGTVNWTVSDGIESADLSINGGMSMTMQIGMDAKGLSDSIPIGSVGLAQIPLGSIDVPDIMTIGPQLDISASASVTISATGSMLAGATLNWAAAAADLILDGPGSSGGSGWTPTFTPVSSVEGSISATLNLNLPVELAIGVNLLDGKYNKNIGITDTPTLQLTAEASNAAPCEGVGLSAGVSNNVEADILGLTTIPIATYSTALYSTCIGSSPTTTPLARRDATAGLPAEKVRGGRRYRQVV